MIITIMIIIRITIIPTITIITTVVMIMETTILPMSITTILHDVINNELELNQTLVYALKGPLVTQRRN